MFKSRTHKMLNNTKLQTKSNSEHCSKPINDGKLYFYNTFK